VLKLLFVSLTSECGARVRKWFGAMAVSRGRPHYRTLHTHVRVARWQKFLILVSIGRRPPSETFRMRLPRNDVEALRQN
jgi:hypothetical protein